MTAASVVSPVVAKIFGRSELGEAQITRAQEHQFLSAALSISADRICSLRQIHSDRVVRIHAADFPRPGADLPEGDALVTDVPGTCLVIRTADCLPVLMSLRARRQNGLVFHAIGAAHAGWRGLAAGIVEKTTAELRSLIPADANEIQYRIHFGPAISGSVYEVGPEVAAHFARKTNAAQAGKFLVDLALNAVDAFGNALDLEARGNGLFSSVWNGNGNEAYEVTEWNGVPVQINLSLALYACTMTDNNRYFSHRRGDQGRNLNAILLAEDLVHG